MGHGEVLEQGTHNELLDAEGPYSQLVLAQKLATQEDADTLADSPQPEAANDPEKKIFTPEQAEAFAANEKPQLLARTSTRGSISSKIIQERMKGESERGPVLSYPTIFRRMAIINKQEKNYYIFGFIASILSGCVYPCFGTCDDPDSE